MLSKSVTRLSYLNSHFSNPLLRQQLLLNPSRAFSAGGQYDVCVIGGGPGGK